MVLLLLLLLCMSRTARGDEDRRSSCRNSLVELEGVVSVYKNYNRQ